MLEDILILIDSHALFIKLIALAIYQYIQPKLTAFSLVLFCVCILDILHIGYQKQLQQWFSIKEYADLIVTLWFFGFAISDFLLVYFCLWFCKRKHLAKDPASKFILLTFLLHGTNQLLCYADRYMIKAHLFERIYTVAVPTLNVAMVLVCSGYAVLALYRKLKSRRYH